MVNLKKINRKKRGASVIMGYILLVTLGLVMSGIAYNFMKTYVPQDIASCPDDSSIFIKEYSCNLTSGIFNITLKNNGKFNLDGFIIWGANDTLDEIATENLIKAFVNDSRHSALASEIDTSYIKINLGITNDFKPTEYESYWFDLNSESISIKKVEITPTVIIDNDGTPNLGLCSNAKISHDITCS